ncbi:MAG: nuclear transport factor 2 family protein [Ferruginibacter sp.]|nr:nuclear transport factor 2 family protein [Ferruginibacter sp.]
MKKILFFALVATFCITLFSCTNEAEKKEVTSSFNLDSVKAAIAASNATFGGGFATGDSTAFVSHYTSDACINPSNMPKMCGTQAITAFFNGGYKMGIRGVKITTDEVMGGKDGVIETGAYEMFADKGVSIDKGKFIVMWKEENGKWKMHRDVWNTNLPAASAK